MGLFRIRSYAEFWPFYLGEHRDLTCRRLHFIGTTIAISSLLLAIFTGQPAWLVFMVLGSYAFAWVGHFVFEKNKPATFKYPWWSLISDFRMYFYWLAGKLDAEYAKISAAPISRRSAAIAAK